jgi:hypothetical protein
VIPRGYKRVAGLLRHPLSRRVGGDPGQVQPAGVVLDEEQRRGGQRQPGRRAVPGRGRDDHGGQGGWLVADPADLAAQDRVLVPERQELGILGHLPTGQHCQAAQQGANEQVEGRNDHSAMIPAGKPDQARSNNRAPQGGRAEAHE